MTYSFTGFTPKADAALNAAVKLASGLGHTYVGTEHLALALTDDGGLAGAVLRNAGVRREAAEARLRLTVGAGLPTDLGEKDLTPRLTGILTEALSVAAGEDVKAGTGHLLQAMLRDRRAAGTRLLADLGASPSAMLSSLRAGAVGLLSSVPEPKKRETALEKYGTDLTRLACEGRLDPVHGRDEELSRVIRILCRRTKNNPCLIGEAGVGKTAVVEALASRMASGDVPPALAGRRLITLELNRMVAGAKYRGDFEERIRDVLGEVKRDGDVILFIDEVHNLMGAGSAEGAVDAANILKPALSRGGFRLIGATTADEYRRSVEKDKALSRRFQTVRVPEPTPEKCLAILKCLKEKYESFHGVSLTDDALEAAVGLSVRFLPDRFLPDKAIDLMDEACAAAAAAGQSGVTRETIEKIAGEVSGVPVASLIGGERERLLSLEARLSEIVIGQDEAVKSVSAAVRRARTGLSDPERPFASFLFCGPTGVGKTLLARALAGAVFGSENAVIVTDLSLFAESHTAAGLFGAPPGYVGYGEGETLVKKLKKQPYSVLLFDELEKAHPAVLPELLGMLETGTVSSPDGETASCRHTIIIMTSNLPGASRRAPGFLGGAPASSRRALDGLLPPEFLNRVDEVVTFRPLGAEALAGIAQAQLDLLAARARAVGTVLTVAPGVPLLIGREAAALPDGARTVRRRVVDDVETPLAVLLLGDPPPAAVFVSESPSGALKLTPEAQNGAPKREKTDEKHEIAHL